MLFTSFTGLYEGKGVSAAGFLQIPVSILLGVVLESFWNPPGFVFPKIPYAGSVKILLFLSIAFLLVALENALKGFVPLSGLLAVMGMGAALRRRRGEVAKRLSLKFSKLWVAAELILFVLVGAAVDIRYAAAAGAAAAAAVLGALVFRICGVACCLIKTPLSRKERFFCMLAYTPKATVQAAIGAVPLAMGLPCGQIVLTVDSEIARLWRCWQFSLQRLWEPFS